MVHNIAQEYVKYYTINCPLTAGWDSRINLAILLNVDGWKPCCFTMAHSGKYRCDNDVLVAKMICDEMNIEHKIQDDVDIPQEILEYIIDNIDLFPRNNYSYLLTTIQLALTIKETIGTCAIVNGNTIDHLGKIGLFKSALPHILPLRVIATVRFANSEGKMGRQEAIKWEKEMLKNCSWATLLSFGLSQMEMQLGRHFANSGLVYSLLGVTNLNLFNCQEICELWQLLPEKLRQQTNPFHLALFKKEAPNMLEFKFNSHKISKRPGYFMTMAFFLSKYLKSFVR